MGLLADLESDVKGIFAASWKIRDGRAIPNPDDVQLGNDAIKLNATVLYADLADSTSMVDRLTPALAAEYTKPICVAHRKSFAKKEGKSRHLMETASWLSSLATQEKHSLCVLA